MSWRLAFDMDPDNPNPHPLVLDNVHHSSMEAAYAEGEREEEEGRAEYGEEYQPIPWIVLLDKEGH